MASDIDEEARERAEAMLKAMAPQEWPPGGNRPIAVCSNCGHEHDHDEPFLVGEQKPCRDLAAAECLAQLISNMSEDYFSAGWMLGIEFILWGCAIGDEASLRRVCPTERGRAELLELRQLSERCGGWVSLRDLDIDDDERDERTDEDSRYEFVPMWEWLRLDALNRDHDHRRRLDAAKSEAAKSEALLRRWRAAMPRCGVTCESKATRVWQDTDCEDAYRCDVHTAGGCHFGDGEDLPWAPLLRGVDMQNGPRRAYVIAIGQNYADRGLTKWVTQVDEAAILKIADEELEAQTEKVKARWGTPAVLKPIPA